MQTTVTPAPKSSLQLEIELPPERLSRAVDEAVRRLSRQTRVPGFRPGKAPRPVLERVLGPGVVLDEAVEHLVQDAYTRALVEKEISPLANANVEVVQAEEGKPLIFKAIVPIRPNAELGDYREFPFAPEIEEIDDPKVDKVIDELRDQNATYGPVEGRPAAKGDYAVIKFVGKRDGEPFDGGSSDRMPLLLGEERLIPGFEDHVIGLEVGGTTTFDITFPEDYPEESLQAAAATFEVELRELREKVAPEADDEFARSMGAYADLAALRADIRHRLQRNALDRARHEFADRIIEYAVSNATLELPDVLVDQEVEVMHDELRASLRRQGLDEAAFLKVTEKTEADLHAEFRPNAEQRVKTLLVLTAIAEAEGVTVPDADVDAEVARGASGYAGDPKFVKYLESERGRNFVRTTLRRSRVVEKLIDEWLAAHPEHPAMPHAEGPDEPETLAAEAAAAAAAELESDEAGAEAPVAEAPVGEPAVTEPEAEPASEEVAADAPR